MIQLVRHAVACALLTTLLTPVLAQADWSDQGPPRPGYWQQRADYTLVVTLDAEAHRYTGTERIEYTNNSPDTLTRFFFHLYPNAFQPGSMMDVRSQALPDADRRVGDRISKLTAGEVGYLHVESLTQNGKAATLNEEETILVVELVEPILPGETTGFELTFSGQVPLQVRRSGRDNEEGIEFSMTQWYPKVVEYDFMGWNPNPYVGREFHGVWGDFDVSIALPANYVFAGTGYETEVDERAFPRPTRRGIKRGTLRAHRRLAPRVHDFSWAADPEYERLELVRGDSLTVEFYFQPGEETTENWEQLPLILDSAFAFVNRTYGRYPYKKYAFIQGGDGGMEYAMCTLITGERTLPSLVGVAVHELMHSWFQFLLATNESLYPWMDEGFTSFAAAEVMNHLAEEGLVPGLEATDNPHLGTVEGYARFANTGAAEALSTHADHYTTNGAYGVGSYVKGELFLYELRSLIGEAAFDRGMRRYFDTWKFYHPTPNDFVRIMEKESGQQLDWYAQYMINTTHQVDYAVDSLRDGAGAEVVLRRVGVMPFPVRVRVVQSTGERTDYYIPIDLQRGSAPLGGATLLNDWPWTNPTYRMRVDVPSAQIERIEVDPDIEFSDADRSNNIYPGENGTPD